MTTKEAKNILTENLGNIAEHCNETKNCHGCKHLEQYKQDGNGCGYCCMVEESQQGKAHSAYLFAHRAEYELGQALPPSIKIRKPNMERCELYEAERTTK